MCVEKQLPWFCCYGVLGLMSCIYMLVCGWSFALKGFWALWDNIYEYVSCYNCHGNAVKGFWASCLLSICWFVGDRLLFRDFGPYGITLKCVCCYDRCRIMLLKDFGPLGVIFMTICAIFPSFLTGKLLVIHTLYI
jgi:hypothetical protein